MSEYEDVTVEEIVEEDEEEIVEDFTVIIDIGEGFTKVGYAGEEEPRSVFPTITGQEKYKNVMVDVGAHTKQSYVGEDCMNMRGVLRIKYPISRGNIMDWDAYFSILTHIFYNVLRIDPSKANILYAENPLTPLQTKQYIARVLFETYKARSVYVASAPILALFSAGLTTGIVIETGEGLTRIVPIVNGKVILNGVQKLNLAGIDVGENLRGLLMQNGISITGTSAEREILREIKERNCFVSLDPSDMVASSQEKNPYVMPDGETVDITMDVRVNAPEILFHPELLGYNTYSIPQAVIQCLKRVDRQYWRPLLHNIVLSGGNSMFQGLDLRLEQDITNLLYELGPLPEAAQAAPQQPQKKKMVSMDGPAKTVDTCPECGTRVNLQQSQNCPSCGHQFNNTQINIPNKFPDKCPHCNEDLEEESEFCPFCGKSLQQNSSSIPNLGPMEAPPPIPEFEMEEASEFLDESAVNEDEKVVRIILPKKRKTAIFNGASVVGSLPSFRDLFIGYEEFLENPDRIEVEFSEIL